MIIVERMSVAICKFQSLQDEYRPLIRYLAVSSHVEPSYCSIILLCLSSSALICSSLSVLGCWDLLSYLYRRWLLARGDSSTKQLSSPVRNILTIGLTTSGLRNLLEILRRSISAFVFFLYIYLLSDLHFWYSRFTSILYSLLSSHLKDRS